MGVVARMNPASIFLLMFLSVTWWMFRCLIKEGLARTEAPWVFALKYGDYR